MRIDCLDKEILILEYSVVQSIWEIMVLTSLIWWISFTLTFDRRLIRLN